MTRYSATAPDGCLLEVEARQQHRQLTLSYSFTNATTGDRARSAYVFNRLYNEVDAKRVFQTDPHLVYVTWDADSIVVSKKLFPVPSNVRVEAPVVPCTSRVAPGERLDETLILPVPLLCFAPYPTPTVEYDGETAALAFELGYFLAHPDGEKLAKIVETRQGSAPMFVPFPQGSQSLLRVEIGLAEPVAVLAQD